MQRGFKNSILREKKKRKFDPIKAANLSFVPFYQRLINNGLQTTELEKEKRMRNKLVFIMTNKI